MSLTRRMVLFTAAAVALAVVLSSAACYLAVRGSLRGRIDHQLKEQASLIASAPGVRSYPLARPRLKGAPPSRPYARLLRPSLQNEGALALVTSTGRLYKTPGDTTHFSVTSKDRAVAPGRRRATSGTATAGGTPVRVYVAPVGGGRAVIAERALTDLNNTLHDLAVILVAIALSGIALAVLLGLFVARAAAKPVHALRQAPSTSAQPGISAAVSTSAATTTSAGSARRSTRCSARSRPPSRRSVSSSPTPLTSCGRLWPRSGQTSRCSCATRGCPRETRALCCAI